MSNDTNSDVDNVKPSRPSLSRASSIFGSSRWDSDDVDTTWAGALTLLDVIETFADSRIDLLERRLRAHSRSLKAKATNLIPAGLKTPKFIATHTADDDNDVPEGGIGGGGGTESVALTATSLRKRYRKEVEREVEKIRLKLASKVTDLSATWKSAQIVRTREKVSFLFAQLTLTLTAIAVISHPEWIPLAYTVQSVVYLPYRAWDYKKKAYHYFLFGPIASAIVTWRNSFVAHAQDKVISLFIHIYPPLVMCCIVHWAPGREIRYPAVAKLHSFKWWEMIAWSCIPYIVWQASYWKFVVVDRRNKIEAGQRQTSFKYMLNDKRGAIGKMLQGIKPAYREASFMGGQLVYSIICMLPAATFLHTSSRWSGLFMLALLSVSFWNGASYYIEVFGRKFERELEKLRREMEAATSSSQATSTPGSPGLSPVLQPQISTSAHGDALTEGNSGRNLVGGLAGGLAASPLSLEPTNGHVENPMDELDLDEDKKDK